MKPMYVQYGCGLSAPKEWINFDSSPTLRIQKTPILGLILNNKLNTVFPKNVRYGDIIKGLPIPKDSCKGLYCSHVLEHLSLEDFRIALQNSYRILKKNGLFRCVVPDLEYAARNYIESLEQGHREASLDFINNTILGVKKRPRGLKNFLISYIGNSKHLWMWDKESLSKELKDAGFTAIRICAFNDSEDTMFKNVEDQSRFKNAVAIECKK